MDFVNWLYDLEYSHFGIPKPDQVVFLYMPMEVARKLREGRGIQTGERADGHESNIDHLRCAEQAYLQIADSFGWRKILCAPDGTINSLRTRENTAEEVYIIAKQRMENE